VAAVCFSKHEIFVYVVVSVIDNYLLNFSAQACECAMSRLFC
jgi:hypothetical protein